MYCFENRVPLPDRAEHIARFYGTPTVLRNNARDNFYEALALRHMPSRRQDGQTDGRTKGSGRARVDWTVLVVLYSYLRLPLPVPQSLLRSCVIKRLGKGVGHALSLDSAAFRVPCASTRVPWLIRAAKSIGTRQRKGSSSALFKRNSIFEL